MNREQIRGMGLPALFALFNEQNINKQIFGPISELYFLSFLLLLLNTLYTRSLTFLRLIFKQG